MPINLNAPFDRNQLIKTIRQGVIGKDRLICGPFGNRKITYCDYAASSRALEFIEDYIKDEVLPLYSNTHTTSNTLGYQTTLFNEEARVIIARTINARDDKDAVIFTGYGATGAIDHLIRSMYLTPNNPKLSDSERPIVFVGSHEHHSNLLPWRESICTIVSIPENPKTGLLDQSKLNELLDLYADRPLKIGSFSGASNVTGIQEDVPAICKLLHKHSALSFWDFAAAGPHVQIDMNPMAKSKEDRSLVHIDALFLSVHKFPGGIGGPGILVAKKALFNRNLPPAVPGGGTVDFVTSQNQVYLKKIHQREEAGTSYIIGCIRAGLVFQLSHAITTQIIQENEAKIVERVLSRWKNIPYIHILGHTNSKRISLVSFVIYHQSGRLLHYGFVTALLNDLFGIQCRGGCACAGPYGQSLLGIDMELARLYEIQLTQFSDVEVLRPGFVRTSFSYLSTDAEVDYIINAVEFIATNGYKLLPLYSFREETNEWYYYLNKSLINRKWLGEISYASGKMDYPEKSNKMDIPINETTLRELFEHYLCEAHKIVHDAENNSKNRLEELSQEHKLMKEDAEELRWFVYPDEAYLSNIVIDPQENNYKFESWRKNWENYCPIVPKYYEENEFLIDEKYSETSKSIICPKNQRNTAIMRIEKKKLLLDSKEIIKVGLNNQNLAKDDDSRIEKSLDDNDVDLGKENLQKAAPTACEPEATSNGHKSLPYHIPMMKAVHPCESEEFNSILKEIALECPEKEIYKHETNQDEDSNISDCYSNGICDIKSCTSDNACKIPLQQQRVSVKTILEKRRLNNNHQVNCNINKKPPKNNDSFAQLEQKLFKQILQAIRDFDLLSPNDRVLVGVSGGKDSLTLLNLLIKARRYLPYSFEIGAVTIDPQTLEYDPSPLKNYMQELEIPYFYDSQPLISIAGDIGPSSICAWCSRMKRGILHNICIREKYNVLALGHHLDDLAESFFMYCFHNGKLDTIKASTVVRAGALKIIRPLAFVREKDTKTYAKLSNLPVITENCPACFEEPKERARVKALLKSQEKLYGGLFGNLMSAIKPLMHPELHLDQILIDIDKRTRPQKNIKYFPKRKEPEKIQKLSYKPSRLERLEMRHKYNESLNQARNNNIDQPLNQEVSIQSIDNNNNNNNNNNLNNNDNLNNIVDH